MHLNTIPRTAVRVTLLGLRLPICGVEVLPGQTRNASLPPAITFGGFEAEVKQVVGSMLRDGELVEEGRVQQAKVTELRRAVELEVQADQKRAAGDRELREEQARAKEERNKAKQDTLRREQQIERDQRACRAAGSAGSSPRRPRPSRRPPSRRDKHRDRGRTRRKAHACRPGVDRPRTATACRAGHKSRGRRERRARAEEGGASGQEVAPRWDQPGRATCSTTRMATSSSPSRSPMSVWSSRSVSSCGVTWSESAARTRSELGDADVEGSVATLDQPVGEHHELGADRERP